MRREIDAEARRLLAEIERLEAGAWPEVFEDYAAALLALGMRCEAPAGVAEVYRWARRGLFALLDHGAPARRQLRADALADVAASSSGLLWRCRAGLDRRRRPNLLSVWRAAVIWRASDLRESLHARHQRRQGEAVRPARSHVGSAFAAVHAREVCALLAGGDAPARALLLIGQGESIAGAARRTGASRQQVYRARELLRERCGWGVPERPPADDP